MSKTTLFQLRSDGRHVLDGSTLGVAIQSLRNVTILQGGHGLRLDQGGTVELAKNPRLANIQSFTIEATVTPRKCAGSRRNIVEAQEPPIALFIQPDGQLVGSVHTNKWVSVDSGQVKLVEGKTASVRFMRHPDG